MPTVSPAVFDSGTGTELRHVQISGHIIRYLSPN